MMAPSFYIHPKSIRASHDGTVKFKCAARGFPRPNIAWLKDGAEFKDTSAKMVQRNMNESSELIMTILSVSDRHVGYYACLATILDTHVSSREAELSLKGKKVYQYITMVISRACVGYINEVFSPTTMNLFFA